jgi:hypothetical protein
MSCLRENRESLFDMPCSALRVLDAQEILDGRIDRQFSSGKPGSLTGAGRVRAVDVGPDCVCLFDSRNEYYTL